MSHSSPARYTMPLTILGILVAVWGILGILDIGNATQAGFDTDGNNTITQVFDGPAKAAGLQVGDRLVSINGISTENVAELRELGRADVGEVRVFEVSRNGEMHTLEITYAGLLQRTKMLAYAGTLIGFCFLGFCLLAYRSRPSDASLALALVGLGLGMAFMGGPYIEDAVLRGIANTIGSLFTIVGVASLLRFVLMHPSPRPITNRSNFLWMLYGPGLLLWLLFAYRQIFAPDATDQLNTITNIAAGIVFGGYLLLTVITMIRNHAAASSETRDAKGLNLMLWGTIIGLGPVMVSIIVGIFAPQLVLPGQDFYFLALILIPLTWSAAVRKA